MVAVGHPAAAHPVKSQAGTTYYVSPSGRDAAGGKTAESPFRHIQKCADVMVPGDTCLVLSGTYEETVVPTAPAAPNCPSPTAPRRVRR